ncbi:ABC transporter substrate-binding protein [Modestobacter versicolor]|uniref:ABC transporter substrate-binding protein n=1 Tax=Modestobacter versicolor TaxID=429133 RepID=UPI0034DF4235
MNRTPAAAAAALSAALLLTACGGSSSSDAVEDQVADLPEAELVAPIADMECTGTAATGEPIVVGGSLSLTGPLAPTAAIHEAVAELVVDWVNECGGVDGRPLEWQVVDDQSTPGQAASNYERLIADGVDVVMGPYGGATTLAGAGPVGRAGYAYPTHTNGAPDQLIGEFHFPAWQFGDGGSSSESFFTPGAEALWGALESSGNPPESAFFAVSQFPTTISLGTAAKQVFESNGVEIAGDVSYELGSTDFSSIALRVQQADPDFIYLGALGGDLTNFMDALTAIGYTPRGLFASLAAPVTYSQLGAEAEGFMTQSIWENQPPLSDTPVAQYFAQEYVERAEAGDLFPLIETQAAGSFGAWQILLTGMVNAGVDNAAIIAYLNGTEVETLAGAVGFDGFNNYNTDLTKITQIQDGERQVVWPEDVASADIQFQP